MSDPYKILDDYDKAEMERQFSKVRNRMLLNKKSRMAKESAPITYLEDGILSKRAPAEVMGNIKGSAAVDDGKGGYKRASVENAVLDNLPRLNLAKIREDFGDAGSRARGELDPTVSDKLNTVNVVDDEWYNLDDKGDSYHIDDGEKGAMELMRDGAKPGLGVMSARRIALQRAKNKESPVNMRLYDMPNIKLSKEPLVSFAARVVEGEENEPEPKPEDEEVQGAMRKPVTRR